MIGFYDYTIILTFIGLITSVFGITQAVAGNFGIAMFCLALSGLCDAFDGRVARSKKNRTEDEKSYGIQLDSLCDMTVFGALPAVSCWLMGVKGIIGYVAIAYYCVCSVTRLAYFNVIEINRMNGKEMGEKVYHGLPITSIAVILPVLYTFRYIISEKAFVNMLTGILFVVGTCFITDFKVRKPKKFAMAGLIVLVGAAMLTGFMLSRHGIGLYRAGYTFKKVVGRLA